MNTLSFHAAQSSGRRVQPGRRVAPYAVTIELGDDGPPEGYEPAPRAKGKFRKRLPSGKYDYWQPGQPHPGTTKKPAATPKAPRGKKGGKVASNSQRVQADGTGGPSGPGRKPTSEERVASARIKAKLPPPFKGPAAVKRATEDLETFLSSAPANREKMVAEYVQAFQDMALSGGPDATATAMRSLGIRSERETLTNAEIARQVTPERVGAFIQGVAREYEAMRVQVRKAYENEREEVGSHRRFHSSRSQDAFHEAEKTTRAETNEKVKKLLLGWANDKDKAALFEQILKFKQ